MPVAFIGAVAAISVRFRRGDPIQRQQVKWLAAVVSVGAATVVAGLLLSDTNPDLATALIVAGVLALFALPFVIGMAILRYRLYEIDRISQPDDVCRHLGDHHRRLRQDGHRDRVRGDATGGGLSPWRSSTLAVAALFSRCGSGSSDRR
jgi:hypothetical protein